MRRSRPVLSALALLIAAWWPGAAVALTPIRIGTLPIVGNAALYCAMDHGAPASEGIDIQTVDFQSGTRTVEALAAGSVDIAFSATLSILQAAQQGLDLVIIAPASFKTTEARAPTSALVARKDAGITVAGQLRGRTIAVNSLRSLDYLIMAEYLARGGVAAREVRWHELSYPHIVPALDQGRVDAAVLAEPFLTVLGDTGRASVLSTALDIIPGTATASYATLRSATQARGPALEAFLRTLRRGIEACERDPERMRDAVVKHTRTTAEIARRIGLPVLRAGLGPEGVRPLMELARRHGLLERDVDLGRLLWVSGPAR